jgi:hypothetical protein
MAKSNHLTGSLRPKSATSDNPPLATAKATGLLRHQQLRLESVANAAAHIANLAKLRTTLEGGERGCQGGENLAWLSETYAGAIDAGIEALADSIADEMELLTSWLESSLRSCSVAPSKARGAVN